jgi:hypothetical protein
MLRGAYGFEHLITSDQVQKLIKSGEKFDVCLLEVFARDALLVSREKRERPWEKKRKRELLSF